MAIVAYQSFRENIKQSMLRLESSLVVRANCFKLVKFTVKLLITNEVIMYLSVNGS